MLMASYLDQFACLVARRRICRGRHGNRGTDDGAKLKSLVETLPCPLMEHDVAHGVSTAEIGLMTVKLMLDKGEGRWIDAKANYLRRSQAERNLQPGQD